MSKITILLADDHAVVRQGFHQLLELEDDLAVVGEAEDGCQAVTMAKKVRPAVILMDIAMPRLNGLEATRQVLSLLPDTKILILSAHSDEAYRISASACGAVGYLLKQSSGNDIVHMIRAVVTGAVYGLLANEKNGLTHTTNGPAHQLSIHHQPAAALTAREEKVLQLIAEGKANKQVALALDISIKTVEKHRGHVMDKLNIHNTAGLTRYAMCRQCRRD